MSYAYSLMLDVSDRRAVIIGGGRVAVRKRRGLIEAGCANIRVVSVQFCPELPEGVERVAKSYEPGDIANADLVFAATDVPEVNQEIVQEAKRLKIWVGRADFDEEAAGDFTNPAVMRKGALMISVSTSGAPALAGQVCDQLEWFQRLHPAAAAMANLMVHLRPLIRNSPAIGPEERRKLYRDLASLMVLDLYQSGGGPALWQWLVCHHPVVGSIGPLKALVVDSFSEPWSPK